MANYDNQPARYGTAAAGAVGAIDEGLRVAPGEEKCGAERGETEQGNRLHALEGWTEASPGSDASLRLGSEKANTTLRRQGVRTSVKTVERRSPPTTTEPRPR